ncbi:hypothetical protein CC85DRAFT_72010 [Cutaneotrichosporon oleaginosum]|uniref:Uncharacterized protein n=1 Tax=Cutaneotrichosporon oleaginosum TaxID=879819 RepID=A0A0J1B5F8_9TREE|nr:uncharacterized protein CC85DRAFT_72010 [Cutaneotrichosporon oleaginosum]KLT42909.1 hypothetical protein CC85DRAFT_72010 [Cutaneotrichosporon oleaginosum]TXT12612.1 hypothetical protein COLE_03022 [Cutaneotrichosporon oleaginosum]
MSRSGRSVSQADAAETKRISQSDSRLGCGDRHEKILAKLVANSKWPPTRRPDFPILSAFSRPFFQRGSSTTITSCTPLQAVHVKVAHTVPLSGDLARSLNCPWSYRPATRICGRSRTRIFPSDVASRSYWNAAREANIRRVRCLIMHSEVIPHSTKDSFHGARGTVPLRHARQLCYLSHHRA